jgi:hypothetical protein
MANARPQPRTSASADHVGGLIWLVFGAALLYGSWTMDRLEAQSINPVTAPGLLPGLVAIGIIAFALVLLFRRNAPVQHGFHNETAAGSEGEEPHEAAGDWKRLALSWALCVGFAGMLLGRGLQFWLLAGAFVFLHILLLDDPDRVAAQPLGKRAVTAAIIAICTAAVVTVVFQKVFLVRLP